MAKGQFEKRQTPWNKGQAKYPQLKDREWLYHQYVEKELSSPEISDILKCHPVTVQRALKKANIRIRTQSELMSGKNNPNYGKHTTPWNKGKPPSEETLRKMSGNQTDRIGKNNTFYGRKHTAKSKEKMSESKKGKRNSPTTEFKKGITPWMKGKQHTDETKQKLREARKHQHFPKHHTKPELIFEGFCKKDSLPFKYTGDGAFWIGDKPSLNPDFIHLTKKIVIEIFSYHHNSLERHCKVPYSQTYHGRKEILKKYGWKLIVFWQEDLERPDAEQFVLATLKK